MSNSDSERPTSSRGIVEDDGKLVSAEGTANHVVRSKNYETLRRAFREYYFKHGNSIECPKEINQREFGFRHFASDREPVRMIRHLTFASEGEILATAIREVPSDIYCSNAYYRFPSYPMKEKELVGADLIFDIDAKDLHLSCRNGHSYLICENCLQAIKNREGLDRCQLCNSQNLVVESIPCNKCFDGTKNEVRRLLTVLIDDFGIDERSIHTYFSGNEGFHLYVVDPNFLNLDAQARSDISGYLLGKGLIPETIGVYRRIGGIENKKSTGTVRGTERIFDDVLPSRNFHIMAPKRDEKRDEQMNYSIKLPKSGLKYGWQMRLSKRLGIKDSSEKRLRNIVQQKGGYYSFKIELEKIGKELGINIDPQVTMDVHRVFRMPGTLNSKSGLAKTKCSDLESFNPLYEACRLSDSETKVKVNAPIEFTLKDQEFQVDEKTAFLPAYAAIYLVCKRLATAI